MTAVNKIFQNAMSASSNLLKLFKTIKTKYFYKIIKFENMNFTIISIFILLLLVITPTKSANEQISCELTPKLNAEIRSYQPIVNKIIKEVTNGEFRGQTYDELATFVDKFGPRFTGTQNLEDSIDYMVNKLKNLGLDKVWCENVTVPRWVRGKESVTLLEPRRHKIRMLGLGSSVGTSEEGITAEAIVVTDFDDLRKKGNTVKGKIVVYNQAYISYGETVEYRSKGASEAARQGAVAALVRSITPFSLNTPHTGMQTYEQNVTHIPVACISVEDAHMLGRMQARGARLRMRVHMGAHTLTQPAQSRNSVAELAGRSTPDQVVLVSGHLDSWDVGQGAMDDGGGAFISWNSLVVLNKLGLRPRRTLRAVLWTAEEMGLIGAEAYVKAHSNELDNFNFVMESDSGTFWPTGLAVSGTDQVFCIVKSVLNLLSPIGTTTIKKGPHDIGPDISHFVNRGIPGASLLNKDLSYFVYHHTEADTLDIENPKALDYSTVVFAAVAYVIADLYVDLPKLDHFIED